MSTNAARRRTTARVYFTAVVELMEVEERYRAARNDLERLAFEIPLAEARVKVGVAAGEWLAAFRTGP